MSSRKTEISFDQTTLRTQVTRLLIKRIERLKLKPGDVLGTEKDLADTFGVSVRTLREAAGHLRAMGMLISRRRVGLIVSEPDPSDSLASILPLYGQSGENIDELYRLRQVIEMGVIDLTVSQITEAELARMEELADEIERLWSEDRMRQADRREVEFHSLILKATRSNLIHGLHAIIARFFLDSVGRPEISERHDPERNKDHHAICRALRSGNVEGVRTILRDHFGALADRIGEKS